MKVLTGPSEKAKAAFHEAVADVNRYPGDDVENLRSSVAALHSVQPENITLGCGSSEILRMAAEACLVPGKSLVLASPTFESIAHSAKLIGAEVRGVTLTRLYTHDLEGMLSRIDATTGLLYICNPQQSHRHTHTESRAGALPCESGVWSSGAD
jgi:histidinol-phosphate aminotransferase